MNVTDVPAQTGLADGAIETLTARRGLTVMVTVLEVAGFPVGQVAFDVNIHVTASLLTGT